MIRAFPFLLILSLLLKKEDRIYGQKFGVRDKHSLEAQNEIELIPHHNPP
jgi:hypothetical protein